MSGTVPPTGFDSNRTFSLSGGSISESLTPTYLSDAMTSDQQGDSSIHDFSRNLQRLDVGLPPEQQNRKVATELQLLPWETLTKLFQDPSNNTP